MYVCSELKTTDAARDDDMHAALISITFFSVKKRSISYISYFRRVVLTNTEHTRS